MGERAVVVAARPGRWRSDVAFAIRRSGVVTTTVDDFPALLSVTGSGASTSTPPGPVLLHAELIDETPQGRDEALMALSLRDPSVAIVLAAEAMDTPALLAALRAGARGYVDAAAESRWIAQAVQAALRGEVALPRAMVDALVEEFRSRSLGRRPPRRWGLLVDLAEREWRTLDLLAAGLTTAEIAERMFVSPVTVRTHIMSVTRKLHVRGRAEVIELLESGAHTAR